MTDFSLQWIVFLAWSVLSIIVLTVFYMMYRQSRRDPSTMTYDVINKKRFRFFYGTIVFLLMAFFAAVSGAPYAERETPEVIIGVKSKMFLFEMTQDTVGTNQLVEFRITTEDVTHGFGIYDSTGTILGQVQAMPKYTNRLRIRFPEPGTYSILCLEYCGTLHHQMRSTITVR